MPRQRCPGNDADALTTLAMPRREAMPLPFRVRCVPGALRLPFSLLVLRLALRLWPLLFASPSATVYLAMVASRSGGL
eukprot:1092156-Alexandrium_andersonii.AAC.1